MIPGNNCLYLWELSVSIVVKDLKLQIMQNDFITTSNQLIEAEDQQGIGINSGSVVTKSRQVTNKHVNNQLVNEQHVP